MFGDALYRKLSVIFSTKLTECANCKEDKIFQSNYSIKVIIPRKAYYLSLNNSSINLKFTDIPSLGLRQDDWKKKMI